jgi:hypothetical protein
MGDVPVVNLFLMTHVVWRLIQMMKTKKTSSMSKRWLLVLSTVTAVSAMTVLSGCTNNNRAKLRAPAPAENKPKTDDKAQAPGTTDEANKKKEAETQKEEPKADASPTPVTPPTATPEVLKSMPPETKKPAASGAAATPAPAPGSKSATAPATTVVQPATGAAAPQTISAAAPAPKKHGRMTKAEKRAARKAKAEAKKRAKAEAKKAKAAAAARAAAPAQASSPQTAAAPAPTAEASSQHLFGESGAETLNRLEKARLNGMNASKGLDQKEVEQALSADPGMPLRLFGLGLAVETTFNNNKADYCSLFASDSGAKQPAVCSGQANGISLDDAGRKQACVKLNGLATEFGKVKEEGDQIWQALIDKSLKDIHEDARYATTSRTHAS